MSSLGGQPPPKDVFLSSNTVTNLVGMYDWKIPPEFLRLFLCNCSWSKPSVAPA